MTKERQMLAKAIKRLDSQIADLRITVAESVEKLSEIREKYHNLKELK